MQAVLHTTGGEQMGLLAAASLQSSARIIEAGRTGAAHLLAVGTQTSAGAPAGALLATTGAESAQHGLCTHSLNPASACLACRDHCLGVWQGRLGILDCPSMIVRGMF